MNTLEVLGYYITVANKLFCLQLYNIYQNKHIIVYLTEVLVLYMSKFNVLHTTLSFTAGIVAETILMSVGYRDRSEKRPRNVLYLAPVYAGQ